MIELPESRHLADQFAQILKGKTVARVIVNQSPHKFAWFHGDPNAYPGLLAGQTITGSDAYGGMAELQIGDRKLIFCDGTNVRYFTQEEPLPKKHQLLLEFEDGTAFACTVQMYGAMFLLDRPEDEGYCKIAKHKIKPLQPEFDAAYFDKLLGDAKPSLSAKAFLATEQRIPGLGNGVLQDILFHARIHPRRKIETLTDAERQTLFQSVTGTLRDMTEQGGRDTEKDLRGQPGGYRTNLSAKTKDEPCPVCGDTIVREAYLGGNVYYCPTCQKFEREKNHAKKGG